MILIIIFACAAHGCKADVAFMVARIFVCALGENFLTNITLVIFIGVCARSQCFTALIAFVVSVFVIALGKSGAANITFMVGVSVDTFRALFTAPIAVVIVVAVVALRKNFFTEIALVILVVIVMTEGCDLLSFGLTAVGSGTCASFFTLCGARGSKGLCPFTPSVVKLSNLVACVGVATRAGVSGVATGCASRLSNNFAVVVAESNVICYSIAFAFNESVEGNGFLTGIGVTLVVTETIVTRTCVVTKN